MNIDSYYEIGTSHVVCEDHSIHGEYEGLSYIIGADGCSSSAGVDLGAGLLCHVAKKQIMVLHKALGLFNVMGVVEIEKILKNAIVQNCLELRSSLKLVHSAFDATLWIVVVYQGKVFIFGWGDGAIIIKSKQNVFFYEKTISPILMKGEDVFVTERRYDSGAPYYLSYKMDYQRDQDYHNNLESSIFRLNEFHYANGKQVDTKVLDVNVPYVHEFDLDKVDIKSITICSDGIETYETVANNIVTKIDIGNVAADFVDYKSFAGSFVERRMLKLKKTFKEKNILHLDDIFCATISLE